MITNNMSEKQKRDKNLYGAMRPLLLVFQLSGLLPIKGLRQNKSEDLQFSWKSIYFWALTVPITFVLVVSLALFLTGCINDKMTVISYIDLGLWVSSAAAPILCINFSKNLKKMINDTVLIETSLPAVKNHGAVIKKIYIILGSYIAVCIFDLILQLYNTATALFDPCTMHSSEESSLHRYLIISERCIFKTITYNYAVSVSLQLRKSTIIYIWNMSSALIISYSMYLEHRLKDFNKRLFAKTAKDTGTRVNWSEFQAQFTKLCILVRQVDKYLTPITSITFFTGISLICQRFYILIGYFIMVILVLTITLVIKTVIMMILTARVHTTSRKPLELLGSMPSSIYTAEAQRFIEQVYHSKVALSGLQLFYFTKGTILTVCGVIVTYELMLFQM